MVWRRRVTNFTALDSLLLNVARPGRRARVKTEWVGIREDVDFFIEIHDDHGKIGVIDCVIPLPHSGDQDYLCKCYYLVFRVVHHILTKHLGPENVEYSYWNTVHMLEKALGLPFSDREGWVPAPEVQAMWEKEGR